jgi:hypothetical protein
VAVNYRSKILSECCYAVTRRAGFGWAPQSNEEASPLTVAIGPPRSAVGVHGDQVAQIKMMPQDDAHTSDCGDCREPADRLPLWAKNARSLECAPDGGQFAGWELTGAAGLSEDESHGQAPHP